MGSQDFVTSTVYGDTIFFSEIMGSKYSVTGPFGHTFSFPDIMGSQDSVTSSTVYGDTISFSEIMDNQYSVTGPYSPPPRSMAVKTPSLVVLFMATQSLFSRSWVVNTPSPGHMATHSLFPRS
ncbi:hypothetical protein BgiBS90_038302 [Biomphalaria glabrata]|nr:hypothetical protein BgiBS90_038346 [Biomphalaria glabrata]KAI8726626.1 hypothetical protein BgiBS90_038302 [Biomphalaria glabrata]